MESPKQISIHSSIISTIIHLNCNFVFGPDLDGVVAEGCCQEAPAVRDLGHLTTVRMMMEELKVPARFRGAEVANLKSAAAVVISQGTETDQHPHMLRQIMFLKIILH